MEISDGFESSDKVLFHSDLNAQIERELKGEGKVSTIQLMDTEVLKDCIVGIKSYRKLGEGSKHVGDALVLPCGAVDGGAGGILFPASAIVDTVCTRRGLI